LASDDAWTLVLPRTKLGPHKQHYFALENVKGKVYTHVKLTIHPDGGVKRLRVIGTRAGDANAAGDALIGTAAVGSVDTVTDTATATSTLANSFDAISSSTHAVTVLPLTAEAFAPFGRVVQAYADPHGAPRGVKVTTANQGSAAKFHKLSLIESSYPEGSGATSALSLFRSVPISVKSGEEFVVRLLERHPYTNQAFIPMSGAFASEGWGADNALQKYGKAYLVIVALNGVDDKPDLNTLRAFVANGGQGIVYDTGIWREYRSHSMLRNGVVISWPFQITPWPCSMVYVILHLFSFHTCPIKLLIDSQPIDFTCVETQIGNGDKADCEIVELDASASLPTLRIPAF
jgi:allantoicase